MMTTREIIIETINKLFIYTDDQEWELLQSEVFTKDVFLDMTSMEGKQKTSNQKRYVKCGKRVSKSWIQ
jgi:anaerobic ribonucleoside-triphosphate reductase